MPGPINSNEIHTKDDVPLREVAERTQNLVNFFNEAERPFRDIFVEEVDQQTFIEELDVERPTWEKLSEGEMPGTARVNSYAPDQLTIRTEEYGQGLGLTQRYIERSTASRIEDKVQAVLEGGKETEEQVIHDVVFNGVANGSTLWFDVPDYGEYTFSNSHDHTFADTSELFGDTNAHEPHRHIEKMADELRHHGWNGRKVALVGAGFKRKLRNEISWDAQYRIPMADGLRGEDLWESTIVIDGVELVQTPYLTGDEFFVVNVDDPPVKYYSEREMQLTRSQGGPVREPGGIINASATMAFGVSMVNPLGAVHFKANSTNFA